jgi:tRNA A-37 threonylcarbamoyl transferase component Bud32
MLESGTVLQGRYRVIRQLGQGGMGAVYHAWDMRLSIPVALKEMFPQADLDPQLLEDLRTQFQQEATVLARLSHPHLVGVTDFFEEGTTVYLVMKFVEGQSLADRIKAQGALPESQVVEWGIQLLDALSYCHGQGILHRDIKPQNIIISDGQAVLVDFGLVKLWDPNDPRTRTAVRGIGTPQYAPPEQYEMASGHTEPRSDLYSLGATLYHALTGALPPTATLRISAPEEFRPIRDLAPNVSGRTAHAIERAMELPRSQRWPSAVEMAEALGGSIRDWGARRRARVAKAGAMGPTQRMDRPAERVGTGPVEGRGGGLRRLPVWAWGVVGVTALLLLTLGGLSLAGAWGGGAEPTEIAQVSPTVAGVATKVPDSPTPSATATATETPAPTATPTEIPTETPIPTSTSEGEALATKTPTPTDTPTASPTAVPTATPTSKPSGAATATPVPTAVASPTEPATQPTTAPPPPGDVGRIIFTVQVGDAFYLYSTDPAWSEMQEIGLTDWAHSTCGSSGTASTLKGTTINVYGISRCGLTERTDACTSPDGAYKVITNFVGGGQHSLSVQDVAEGSDIWYYQGKLNRTVGIQWAWNSRYFIFGVDLMINVVHAGREGYQQVISHYDDEWPPQFSPDGSLLYYLMPVGSEGASDIYVVNVDGSGQRNITNAPIAKKMCPRWKR